MLQLCTELKEKLFLFSSEVKDNDPSANNPPKGQRPKHRVKEILQHFYTELRVGQFCTVLTLTDDKQRPMLKKNGPINMSIRLVQITWMEGSVIMQPWITGITTLWRENRSSSRVLIYNNHNKVNFSTILCVSRAL